MFRFFFFSHNNSSTIHGDNKAEGSPPPEAPPGVLPIALAVLLPVLPWLLSKLSRCKFTLNENGEPITAMNACFPAVASVSELVGRALDELPTVVAPGEGDRYTLDTLKTLLPEVAAHIEAREALRVVGSPVSEAVQASWIEITHKITGEIGALEKGARAAMAEGDRTIAEFMLAKRTTLQEVAGWILDLFIPDDGDDAPEVCEIPANVVPFPQTSDRS